MGLTPMQRIVPGFDIPTITYGANQKEYTPLPAWKGLDGHVVTRWQLTWKERFQVFFGGSLWLSMLTFNKPVQPVKITTECPIMGSAMLDREV